MKKHLTIGAMGLMIGLLACTPAPNTQNSTAKPVHIKADSTQQRAYAQQVRGMIMDKMGLETSVESSAEAGETPVLTITMENMREPLARNIMHAGLEKGAKDMDFPIVRFANHDEYHSFSLIWEYRADGSAQVGYRECKTRKDYSTKCAYRLDAGLSL